MKRANAQDDLSFEDLFSMLDAGERDEAGDRLDRYIALALRIYERSELDRAEKADSGPLTVPDARSTIPNKKPDQTAPRRSPSPT